MAISEKERGREDRGNENRGRPRVDFVPIGDFGRGELRILARVNPKERLLGDDVAITPSKNFRRQQNRAEAKALLARADKGQKVSDRDIERLQQRLASTARQKALRGQESEEKSLGDALGEVRRSRLVAEAKTALAQAEQGSSRPGGYIERLQQRLLGMEQQDQRLGRDSEGFQLALALGAVRRSQLLAEANDVVARAAKGQRFQGDQLFKLQQALAGFGRQEELLGQENEERKLVGELGELRRSQLMGRAKDVLAQAAKGKRFAKSYIKKLQQDLAGFGHHEQLLGQESEELNLAAALADLRP